MDRQTLDRGYTDRAGSTKSESERRMRGLQWRTALPLIFGRVNFHELDLYDAV